MDQKHYDELFETQDENSEKLKTAVSQVSDIRKFEIELYWKRAAYFWTLIAAAFAGYFLILSSKVSNHYFLSFIISCVGFVFTFAWFCANRGSKYWQENWEHHLDLLEDKITGPLYKTLLQRQEGTGTWADRWITGPKSLSVSKINQWAGVFVLFIWFILICYSSLMTPYISPLISNIFTHLELTYGHARIAFFFVHLLIFAVAVLACFFIRWFGKTYQGDQTPEMIIRETRIVEKQKKRSISLFETVATGLILDLVLLLCVFLVIDDPFIRRLSFIFVGLHWLCNFVILFHKTFRQSRHGLNFIRFAFFVSFVILIISASFLQFYRVFVIIYP